MAIGDWMKGLTWLANAGHFLGGGYVVLMTVLFTHSHGTLRDVEATFVVAVLVKEYVIDLIWESGETVTSSTIDALGWCLGNTFALGMVALSRYLGGW